MKNISSNLSTLYKDTVLKCMSETGVRTRMLPISNRLFVIGNGSAVSK